MSSSIYKLPVTDKKKDIRIALFSHFTNKYNNYIPLWLESTAKNFYPENSDVFIVTEKPENKKYETDRVKVVIMDSDDPNIKLSESFKQHKLNYNLEFVKTYGKDYDYVANILSNIAVYKLITQKEYPLADNKITLQAHRDASFRYNRNRFKDYLLQPSSNFYLHPIFYTCYMQVGVFFGPYKEMRNMLQECVYMQEEDRKLVNQGKYRYRQIAVWHDETYMVRWCVDNNDKIIIQTYLARENRYHPDNTDLLYYIRDKVKLDKYFANK